MFLYKQWIFEAGGEGNWGRQGGMGEDTWKEDT